MLRKLMALWREVPRVLPLMRDVRVPTFAKVLAVLGAVLVISPLDLLGDIPVLGFFDDAALLAFLVHLFVSFSERAIARDAAASETIVRNITPEPEPPSGAIPLPG